MYVPSRSFTPIDAEWVWLHQERIDPFPDHGREDSVELVFSTGC
jgi:hypothetical protein